MSQTIALQAQAPGINSPALEQAAQQARLSDLRMENMPLQNRLQAAQLNDAIGEQSALSNYRAAVPAKGQVGALSELNQYPDLQANLNKTMDGMSFEQRQDAQKRAEVFGNAAKYVSAFPDGSPEQEQAWTTSLNVLRKQGFIDDDTFNNAVKSGPNKLLLNEAMSVSEYMKKYTGPQADLTDARIGAVKAGVDRQDQKANAQIDLIHARTGDVETDNERADRRTDTLNRQGDERVTIQKWKAADGGKGKNGVKGFTPQQRATLELRIEDIVNKGEANGTLNPEEHDANVAKLRTKAGLDGVGPAVTKAPSIDGNDQPAAEDDGDGSDENTPAKPVSQADFDALPKGAYFVNPSDGKTMRKR